MNNAELHKRYIREATRYLKELKDAYQDGDWNVVIRKLQEVVELSLKSVLKLLCIEFPKEHDIGKYFLDICREKGILIDEDMANIIESASKDLADKRSPAFYFEEIYDEETAKVAKEQAEKIYNFIISLSEKLIPK